MGLQGAMREREAPERAPTRRRFDAKEAWARLSPTDRRLLGEAAVLFAYVLELNVVDKIAPGDRTAFDAAELAAADLLWRVFVNATAEIVPTPGPPTPPDLTVFGIRQCRDCGCTLRL